LSLSPVKLASIHFLEADMTHAGNPDYLVFWMTSVLGILAWLI
jgi:hypothetical protein